ncbi:SOS response-associated peptidase [Paenibacillus aestuarii]|uniref:Abasic site processing protein n=1 Tax=Paenibacillus aestuarii TaxID=516965 RepID=A0ABW0K2J0_9BACL|nr:SOS response-associated peptidase family protein [Paenibacillus aestuarii]
MCTSISIVADVADLTKQFQIDRLLAYQSNRYEVRPTESLSCITVNRNKERLLDECRWGLMPFWAKEAVCGDRRSIFTNEVFARIVQKQRCIIPCSGFYVSRTEGKETKWIYYKMRSGTFGIAGLYDVWRSPSGDEELRTCMMLMTEANSLVSPYHSSMPAILSPEQADEWLKPENKDPYALSDMLQPMDELLMIARVLDSPQAKMDIVTDAGVLI